MSSVVMLDLGDTLVRGDAVIAHVPEALATISQFVDAAGKPVLMCLVSDFEMAAPPVTPAKVNAKFKKYLELLKGLGLSEFFQPAARRVTLSTHAGVGKPDERIFQHALRRLGASASLNDCVFITENEAHIRHCREKLGMKALHFGKDFTDWREAPLLVAGLLGTEGNLNAAAEGWGEAHGLSSLSFGGPADNSGKIHAEGMQWVPLASPALKGLSGVHVKLPALVEFKMDRKTGRVASVQIRKPAKETVDESIHFVSGLMERGAVETESGPQKMGLTAATHKVEKDSAGRRYLKRKGYSAT